MPNTINGGMKLGWKSIVRQSTSHAIFASFSWPKVLIAPQWIRFRWDDRQRKRMRKPRPFRLAQAAIKRGRVMRIVRVPAIVRSDATASRAPAHTFADLPACEHDVVRLLA